MPNIEPFQEEVGGAKQRAGGTVTQKGTAKAEEKERWTVGTEGIDGVDVDNPKGAMNSVEQSQLVGVSIGMAGVVVAEELSHHAVGTKIGADVTLVEPGSKGAGGVHPILIDDIVDVRAGSVEKQTRHDAVVLGHVDTMDEIDVVLCVQAAAYESCPYLMCDGVLCEQEPHHGFLCAVERSDGLPYPTVGQQPAVGGIDDVDS